MFTGIIESLGVVKKITSEGENKHFTIESELTKALKIDQSISHNGVCLTVVALEDTAYQVTAIKETLIRSNLGGLKADDVINLERAMVTNTRLDGHIVQGHVDATATCIKIEEADGSWYYQFQFPKEFAHLLVDKGSVCINGVSLTLIQPTETTFSVAIIPYTFEHTNFKHLTVGQIVNIEFDILGKYIARYAELYLNKK